jgi:hypothetical protein
MKTLTNIAENQFFQKEHFLTFECNKIYRNTPDILEERREVQQQLLRLNDLLFPEIQVRGWKVYNHIVKEHWVSGIDIDNPFIPNQLRSIWLHYGKHPDEIRRYQDFATNKGTQTFIHHSRIQVIIYNHQEAGANDYGVGIWLVIGKNGGSFWDRDYFKNSMRNEQYQDQFFRLVTSLDPSYFVDCNADTRSVTTFKDKDDLASFAHEPNYRNYFIIGKAFEPDSPLLSEDRIVATVLNEFEKLYIVYEFTRHKF